MNSMNTAVLMDWPKKIEITKLHEDFGSPTWIVSENQLTSNVEIFERFTSSKSLIFYPVKTNPSLTVLQILAKLGVGADCASSSEIDLALYAGIKIENISYNSPAQDVKICKNLLMSGAKVVMDDMEAILELQNEIKEILFTGKLFLRINLPEFVSYSQNNDNQELMAHGHKSSKFGIPMEDLENLLPLITIPISGLHVHVGTQMDNMASFEHAIKELNQLADQLNTSGHHITDINMGGGLGIPFTHDENFPALEHWSSCLQQLKNNKYHYSVEPGHALIGNAVALLTKILTIKNSRGKKWAIVDVGTDQLAKVTLLKWPHRILDESGKELEPGTDAIAGPLCFAGDTLLDNISVANLKKGAPLLITEAGAYTYSLSNKFNGRLAPKWVLIKANNEVIQTMDRETRYDNPQLMHHEWGATHQEQTIVELDVNETIKLSSLYVKETIKEDSFIYLNIRKILTNEYDFTISTSSKVDFISMPFAARIFGDATIIAVLHKDGYTHKEIPVWGRKLSLDCFNKLKSNQPMKFTVTISEPNVGAFKKTMAVRFKTSCGNCAGSFMVTYEK